MTGHLAVDALEAVLLDLCDAPDHLAAGSAECRLTEIILHELVAADRKAPGHVVTSVEDVLGELRRGVVRRVHADREGDGATGGKLLIKLQLLGSPSVQTLLQGGDVEVKVGDGEVGEQLGVVVDGELEVVVLRQRRYLYEERTPVRTGGDSLVL